MNRRTWLTVTFLLSIAAVEFGLLATGIGAPHRAGAAPARRAIEGVADVRRGAAAGALMNTAPEFGTPTPTAEQTTAPTLRPGAGSVVTGPDAQRRSFGTPTPSGGTAGPSRPNGPPAAGPTAMPQTLNPVPQAHFFPTKQEGERLGIPAAPPPAANNLNYYGGPVMHNPTIHAIYWLPPGAITSATYQTLINRYLIDIGATPFYNIVTQYPDTCCAPTNASTFDGSWVDTRAYTKAGTALDPLLDSDIQDEVVHAISMNPKWSAPGPDSMYLVFTGSGVQSCFQSDHVYCFGSYYCAYHGYFNALGTQIIYANMPYGGAFCNAGGSPNGDSDADNEINLVSHEQFEAVTDPLLNAWYDSSGYEVGDKCAWYFGPLSGDGSNVTLGIHHYVVQTEWSNYINSCALSYERVPGGDIAGIVTNTLGTPIAGANVYASPSGCCGAGGATTGPDGTYVITGLVPDTYQVRATGPYCPPGASSPPCVDYVAQYFNGVTDAGSATLVPVTGGATTPGINFALATAGRITGTVRNSLGTPIAGAQLNASADACCAYGYATSAEDGTYEVRGLASGSYRVQASGPYCPGAGSSPPCADYVSQYYDGTSDYSLATMVNVADGATTSGIDFALPLGARIAGTVRNSLGTPVAGVSLYATSDSCCSYGYATSAADGTYVLTGLVSGNYRVQAYPPYCPAGATSPPCVDYVSQYYDGTSDYSAATLVPAASGTTTPNIDFALIAGGHISGTVRNSLGTPVAGAQVNASADACCAYGYATSADDGTYAIRGLAPGSYRVQASGPYCPGAGSSPPCTDYVPQYYDGVPDYGSATLVEVASGSTTATIDFDLLPGGHISGIVADALGTPIAGAQVNASMDGCCGYGYATSGDDGTYLITGLPAGSYRVQANGSCSGGTSSPPCLDYVSQYYDGASDYGSATLVSVEAGVTTPNIDFALAAGAHIAGIVTNTFGTPIAGANVSANEAGCCGSGYGYTTTAADGTYEIAGLSAGSYVVQASGPYCPAGATSPPCVDYVSQFYEGTYDYGSATPVAVTAGATTPNINFALIAGGHISGIVTDALGTPIPNAEVSASSSGCCGYGYATTGADGSYVVNGLQPGSYRVQAAGPYCSSGATSPPCVAYAAQYYDHTYDYTSAALVPTTSGATTPNIDFALAAGGSVSGTITNVSSTPIAGAWVTADRNGGAGGGGFAISAADGTYAMTGLAPGSDVVAASLPSCPSSPSPPVSAAVASGTCTPYPVWFYGGVCEYLAATHVPIVSGGSATSVNVALKPVNPNCFDHAVSIGGLPFSETRSTAGTTVAPGETLPCGNMGATVWYQYTAPPSPPASSALVVDTVGSSFNTAIAVYSQGISPPGVLSLVGCAASGSTSAVSFTANGALRYYIQVGGQQGATGSMTLRISAATDSDGDAIRDGFDNCPSVANPDQKNTDAAPLVTAGAPNDNTIANGDGVGDACDPDIDNDGLPNAVEGSLGPGHANHALCPTASADTDPLKLDTDGDRVTDGAECALGSDPASAASKPAMPPAANDTDHDGLSNAFEASIGTDPTKLDTDGDGIPDGVEYKGYGSNPLVVDTDADGCFDGREIASLNTDKLVNSLDLLLIAQRFNRHDLAVQDVNKDGVINSADLALVAKNFASTAC